MVPLAAYKTIHDDDGMPLRRQIQCRGPSAVAVSPQHGDLHLPSRRFGRTSQSNSGGYYRPKVLHGKMLKSSAGSYPPARKPINRRPASLAPGSCASFTAPDQFVAAYTLGHRVSTTSKTGVSRRISWTVN